MPPASLSADKQAVPTAVPALRTPSRDRCHSDSLCLAFVLILTFFSLTAFNVMLFRAAHRMKPVTRFIEGHDDVYDTMTAYIATAKDSIWATRCTHSTMDLSHEYFATTIRRIKGQNCKPINNYRRIMSVTTSDKAELMSKLISDHAQDRPFALRTTETELNFEIVLMDHDVAFLLFHDPESASSVINGALQIMDRAAVERIRGLFNAEWHRAQVVKDGPLLTDERRESLLAHFGELARTLPD
jgi:hypothetical protein